MTFKYFTFQNQQKLYNIVKCSKEADYYVNKCIGIGPRILSITGSKQLYKYYDI